MNYAGFWLRFFAFLIDSLILLPTYFIQYAASFVVNILYGYILIFAINFFYYTLFESGSWQATPGKKLLGLGVFDSNGAKISFAKAVGRYLSKFISSLIFGIGYLMIIFTDRKQALHDLVASTFVLKVQKSNDIGSSEQNPNIYSNGKDKNIVMAGFNIQGNLIRLSIQISNKKLNNVGLNIGRDTKVCDLCIDDSSVSRVHAKIIKRGSNIYLQDLDSTNGTYINGHKIRSFEEFLLNEEGVISFGDIELSIGEY